MCVCGMILYRGIGIPRGYIIIRASSHLLVVSHYYFNDGFWVHEYFIHVCCCCHVLYCVMVSSQV